MGVAAYPFGSDGCFRIRINVADFPSRGRGMMMLMARCLNGRYDSRVGAMILHWHRALHDGVDVCSECLFYFIIYERHSTIKPLLCGKFSVVAQSRPV